MIEQVKKWMPIHGLFLAFNASAFIFLVLFVLAPILARFASRSEDIVQKAEQLSHFQNLVRNAKGLVTAQSGDLFKARQVVVGDALAIETDDREIVGKLGTEPFV